MGVCSSFPCGYADVLNFGEYRTEQNIRPLPGHVGVVMKGFRTAVSPFLGTA